MTGGFNTVFTGLRGIRQSHINPKYWGTSGGQVACNDLSRRRLLGAGSPTLQTLTLRTLTLITLFSSHVLLATKHHVRYTALTEEYPLTKAIANPPTGFDELSVDEQVDYVQSLWDHMAAHPETIPVPDWHRQVIAERVAAYEKNPTDGKPWEEVRDELLRELRKSTRSK